MTENNNLTLVPVPVEEQKQQDTLTLMPLDIEIPERPKVIAEVYRGVEYSFDTELMDILDQEGYALEAEIRNVIDTELDAGKSVSEAANAVGAKANELLEVLVKRSDATYTETVRNQDGSTSETFHGNQDAVENDVDNAAE